MALLLVDPEVARAQVATFRAELAGVGVHYAVKALDHPEFLAALAPWVDGFDVASLVEVERLLALGVPAGDLFFSNPVKPAAHVARAHQLGVRQFTLDSPGEVDKIAREAPGAEVVLRVAPPPGGARFPLVGKFGMWPPEAPEIAARAAAAGLSVVGVTFHVGSQCADPRTWHAAIEVGAELLAELAGAGLPADTLNLGGGFPADYDGSGAGGFAGVAAAIREALAPWPGLQVVAEPGRFIAAPAGVLRAAVIGRVRRGGQCWLYTDVGAYNGLVEPLVDRTWRYPVRNHSRPGSAHDTPFVLTGPTCDSTDTLGAGYLLPHDTDEGDIIEFQMAGAYSVVCASNFNGFQPPGVRVLARTESRQSVTARAGVGAHAAREVGG